MKATSRLGAQLAPFGRGFGVACRLSGVLGALAGCPSPRAEPPRVVPDAGLARASAEAGPPVTAGRASATRWRGPRDDERIAVFAGAYLSCSSAFRRRPPRPSDCARDSDLDARDKASFGRDTGFSSGRSSPSSTSPFRVSAGPPAAASAASRTDLALLRGMLRADSSSARAVGRSRTSHSSTRPRWAPSSR